MIVSCWSAKGGSGTTVVAIAIAALRGRAAAAEGGSLLIDCAGDAPSALGMPEPSGPGLGEWLAAGSEVPADALRRLEHAAAGDVSLIGCGHRPLGSIERAELLLEQLGADGRPVVIDVGWVRAAGDGSNDVMLALAAGATESLLVTRPCFLSLRRALALPLRPTGIILVAEEGRALGRNEIEDILGAPVVAEVPSDATVSRAVEAGLLAARLPRVLERGLRHAA